jgi:hypothetical protein
LSVDEQENGDLQEEVSDLRAENKRLQRQLLATGERENVGRQFNVAVRNYAKSFAFTRLLWLSSTGKELLLVDLPNDYSPVPNWPDNDVTDREAKRMALERELWEIQQHLTSVLRETTLTATFFSKVFVYSIPLYFVYRVLRVFEIDEFLGQRSYARNAVNISK